MAGIAAYVEGWIGHRQETLRVPGVAVAIACRGDLLLDTAFGVADVSTGTPLRPTHLFRIASHSKTFTATAIFQLVETGALRLDDTLGDGLPWLAGHPAGAALAGITVADALGHSSGIVRDGTDGDYWQLMRPFPDGPALHEMLERGATPLVPNARFHYSNIAYSILGEIIERVAGRPYGDHIAEAITGPLGLHDTAADYIEERAGDYAAGHTHAEAGAVRIPIDHVTTGAMAAATGFTSTASDLARYWSAHCFGEAILLTDASKRRMQRVQWTQHKDEHYGLGLMLRDIGERRLIGHSGGYPGHKTRSWCDPEEGWVVVVLTNAIDGPASDLCTGVVRLIDRMAQPAPSGAEGPPAADPMPFTGRWVNLWGSCDIAYLGGRLVQIQLDSSDPSDSLADLAVVDDSHLRLVKAKDGYANEGELFTLERDGTGKPVVLRGESAMSYWRPSDYARRYLEGPRVSLR